MQKGKPGVLYIQIWTGALGKRHLEAQTNVRETVCLTQGVEIDSFEVLRKGLRNQSRQHSTGLGPSHSPAESCSPYRIELHRKFGNVMMCGVLDGIL